MVVVSGNIIFSCDSNDSPVRRAVKDQLKKYPESGLQDIYKSFFQDEFGPGHLQPDSSGASSYLDHELSQMTGKGRHTAEPCGTGRNFCRVPLDLVRDGMIPREAFLSAFLESARDFEVPDIPKWKSEWELILAEIEAMNLNIPDFEKDKKALAEILAGGEAVVHHSDRYIEAYDPHYRIMTLEKWEELKSGYK